MVVYMLHRVIDGWETLDDLEKVPVHEKTFKPTTDICIRRVTIHANPLAEWLMISISNYVILLWYTVLSNLVSRPLPTLLFHYNTSVWERKVGVTWGLCTRLPDTVLQNNQHSNLRSDSTLFQIVNLCTWFMVANIQNLTLKHELYKSWYIVEFGKFQVFMSAQFIS